MKEYKVQPLDLMQYINTKYHEPFIHELIEFENELDTIKFSNALDKLIDVFPILKCRYDSESNKFVENNITGNDLLKIDNNADRETLLTESLDMNEKLVQFTLSQNILVITISHLVCDGSGFKRLLYQLCDIYNGNDDGNYAHLMNREFSQLTKNLKGTAAMTMKMLFSMFGSYKNKQVYEKTDDESVYIAERTITVETMLEVHKVAKAQGATLNDVFLTAYARAIGKLYSARKINIPCTVDLRKYAKEDAGIANLTGTYNLNVKINTRSSFSESLRDITQKMNEQKCTKNDIAGPMLLVSKYEKSTIDKFLKLYGGMNTGAYTDYTNLGKLDEDKLVFDGAIVKNAIGYSGLNKAPCFQIAISSFKGVTTVSSIFECGVSSKKKVDSLMDAIVEEIKDFANKI